MRRNKRKLNIATYLGFAVLLATHVAYAQADDKAPVATVFKENCSACHGEDGAGSPLGKRLKAPDLRSKEVHGKTTAKLVNVISAGRDKMPPFGEQLSTDQINALVEYVRSLSKPVPEK